MVYVHCGSLDEVKEVPRKSEIVFCKAAQIGGGDVNLFFINKWLVHLS